MTSRIVSKASSPSSVSISDIVRRLWIFLIALAIEGAILEFMEKESKLYLRPTPPVAEASSKCLKGIK